MSMKKIILFRHLDGYTENRIARELRISRETVRHHFSEYRKAGVKFSDSTEPYEALI